MDSGLVTFEGKVNCDATGFCKNQKANVFDPCVMRILNIQNRNFYEHNAVNKYTKSSFRASGSKFNQI